MKEIEMNFFYSLDMECLLEFFMLEDYAKGFFVNALFSCSLAVNDVGLVTLLLDIKIHSTFCKEENGM